MISLPSTISTSPAPRDACRRRAYRIARREGPASSRRARPLAAHPDLRLPVRECRWVHSRLSRVRLRAQPAPPPTLNTSCRLACVRHVVSSDTAFRHASRLAAMTRFPERSPSVVSPPPRLDHRRARGLVAPVPRGFRCGVRPSAVRGGGSGSANRTAWQRGPGSESAAALGGLQWLEVVSLREAGRFASRREASVEEADWRLFQKFGVGALAAPAVVLVLAQQPGEPGVVGVAIESLLRHSVPMQFLGR